MVVLQLNTVQEFEKAIQDSMLVVVYFYDEDNYHCNKVGPWFHALDKKYDNQAKLYTVDINKNRLTA